jgi:cytochrome c biogenesis protein CcdA/thiol-disulfide isomerase/thioredoxin
MGLLLLFAFLAGAGTALSPCVLPVLPALLSAGAAGGRRRPLGIALGLAATFTVTIAGLATVVDGVGLGDSALRTAAIVALAGFGLVVAVPRLAARVESPLSRLARFGPRSAGHGFWSGLAVGAALGFLYAPCAGPILAAVVSVSAASGRTVAVGAAYALGSAAVLLVLALAGRAVVERIRRAGRGPHLQRALGAVLVLTAVAIGLGLDVRFQSAIAGHLPSAVVNPTGSLERSAGVSRRLAELRAPSRYAAAGDGLEDYGPAPEFAGLGHWLNSRPLTLAALRGRVVLIDFWTYTCINCLRTLPHLEAWDRAYRRDGLTIVGVHTPEFGFEHDLGNVASAVRREGIRYPVAQDNDYATWQAWSNDAWPAEYLIDARGHVRHVLLGEGEYAQTEQAIRALLQEAGAGRLGAEARPRRSFDPADRTTPETYLGLARAQGVLPLARRPGTATYPPVSGHVAADRFVLGGTWRSAPEAVTAGPGAELAARVTGKDVYLVLAPPAGGTGAVRVTLDGAPQRTVRVTRQQLYHLISRPRAGTHDLGLRFSPGVAAYAFTFG